MSSTQQILALDISGRPYSWLSADEAVTYYAKDKVAWEIGGTFRRYRGGTNASGLRSQIDIAPVIAIAASELMAAQAWETLPLSDRDNALLFRRDHYTCAYCANRFSAGQLTRDHVVPRSRGGGNAWTNCVTCCRGCNQMKAAKLVQDFRPLVYVPYAPCRYEHFLLSGRNILADQHEYLAARVSRSSRLRVAM